MADAEHLKDYPAYERTQVLLSTRTEVADWEHTPNELTEENYAAKPKADRDAFKAPPKVPTGRKLEIFLATLPINEQADRLYRPQRNDKLGGTV
jgi:hypothetical protein